MVPSPRELADLPFADHLRPFDGGLAEGGDYDTVHLDGDAFDGAVCDHARFLESAFSSVTFTGGRGRGARFNEVWLDGVRWVGTDLADTDWLDGELGGCVLAGLEMFSARLHRVTFHRCKLESVNLRTATLRNVTFVDCLLRDVDLGGAGLTEVAFPGAALEGVRFGKARMAKVDLRGATRLEIADGYDALGGATIGSGQLMELAPMLADALGIAVRDGGAAR
ncbi:pentapeptide repeat-containing protein [Streptomyces sp. MK37H]|uniref:pentapeptide repeat-containing protein n=1 Tax=Streptomyces sp. MK37H TaxID=2699117 RepID=UPI001B360CA0|nr:pentapeptide repeat-containing protein [Streptomyces sp. MK37H]MBP8537522.1 pentapeptide repeat-containing protein [Streptomyces sp. MK37H]